MDGFITYDLLARLHLYNTKLIKMGMPNESDDAVIDKLLAELEKPAEETPLPIVEKQIQRAKDENKQKDTDDKKNNQYDDYYEINDDDDPFEGNTW